MSVIARASKNLLSLIPGGTQTLQRRASGVGYNAAGNGRRAQGWDATIQGVNSVIFADAFNLIKRSRREARQNPWAVSAISKFVTNAIGNGIDAQPQHPDRDVRNVISEAWKYFDDEADLDGNLSFRGMQSLACRSTLEGGESFTRMMTITDDDDILTPLQLRLMESEQLPLYMISFPETRTGNIVRMGVEMELNTHRKVGYHFFSEHPYETVMFPYPQMKYTFIPKKDIAHHFKPLRPGQIRGIPWLAPVLASLHEIDQTFDAELVRQKTQTLFAGFIQVNSGDTAVLDEMNVTTSDPSGASGLDAAMPTLEPGILMKLLPNETITFAEPKGPIMFGDFMRTALYAVAAAADVTYEQLTGDLSGVNYSSIRAGLLEFRRCIEAYVYSLFIYQFLRPVWRRWMDTAVLAGILDFRDYDNPIKRRQYQSVLWQPPGWDWVDPQKDIAAAMVAVRGGLDSRDRIIRERGLDPEAVDRDNKLSHERAEEMGLIYESDVSQVLERGETLADSEAQAAKEEKEEPVRPARGIGTSKPNGSIGGIRTTRLQ